MLVDGVIEIAANGAVVVQEATNVETLLESPSWHDNNLPVPIYSTYPQLFREFQDVGGFTNNLPDVWNDAFLPENLVDICNVRGYGTSFGPDGFLMYDLQDASGSAHESSNSNDEDSVDDISEGMRESIDCMKQRLALLAGGRVTRSMVRRI